ncbi:MAG: hypothetical protein U0457_03530 [Candidatus Sericytochromatia bacterium]
MSFSNSKRIVLNTKLPKGKRYIYLNSCFENVSFAIRLQFQTINITYSNLRESIFKKLNLKTQNVFYSPEISSIEFVIPEEKITKALEELENLRNKFIMYNKEYSNYRKLKKLNGQNKVSKKDYLYLKSLENRLIYEFKI